MIAFIAGVIVGIVLAVAYNAWKPDKFDQITDSAERKVKELKK